MLPALAKFYHLQPSEFWRLESDELLELMTWMTKYQHELEKANRG